MVPEAAEVLPYPHQYETMHALQERVQYWPHFNRAKLAKRATRNAISLAVLHGYYNSGSRLLCRDMKVH